MRHLHEQPALDFSNVEKHYGRTHILHDVTFAVARGECFGLVGVNGAGKTTLIKCLLDFCETDKNAGISIFGIAHDAPGARSRLAFLPERFQPPHFLTGAEFIRHVLALHNTPHDNAGIAQKLIALDFDPAALSRSVRTYSKGMTQKLGLAAALLARKELYVLDEPTSGLDPKARALLKTQLRALKDEGRTVFLTSHALADVAEICDRMAVIHDGRVRFVGTPAELCRQFAASDNLDDLEHAFLACIAENFMRPSAA